MSPKERFQLNVPETKQFAGMVHCDLFERAADVAMLQFVENQGYTQDQLSAVASAYRLQGAQQFKTILMTLGDLKPAPTPTSDRLDYTQK
jgi:hypothetical protein